MNFKEEQKEKVEKIEAILREYLPEANGYQSVIMEAMEYLQFFLLFLSVLL